MPSQQSHDASRLRGALRPPYDPELAAVLASLPPAEYFDIQDVQARRERERSPSIDARLHDLGIVSQTHLAPGPHGTIPLTVFELPLEDSAVARPCIYFIHGGAMMVGDSLTGIEVPLEWVREFGAVCISVDYRLAPEHPAPIPLDDAYAGLIWTVENSRQLGIDPDRLVVCGGSAGGGIAAGVALMSRDRHGPSIAAQMLMCAMLDDRGDSTSARQFINDGPWSSRSNASGWQALLGGRTHNDSGDYYSTPARAKDLSNLPPAYIDVGTAEIFRDEDVAYASSIWASGGQAELHVWPGGFHEFDLVAPTAALSEKARSTRTSWLRECFK